MARRLAAQLALGLLYAGGAGGEFIPFANVEELKPRRIQDFCGSEVRPGQDGQGQIRRCQHHFKKTLEDESDIEFGWNMDVDPDSILSLDTEAEHGVRLKRCGPGELELELPESHARHAAEGKLIVGSRFVHNCEHRPDHQLYHRVREVRSHAWRAGVGSASGTRVAHVLLATEELASIAHAVPKLSFYFSWMPSEAKQADPFPKMKTDYGLNRAHLRAQKEKEENERRRLFGLPSLPDSLKGLDGGDMDNGGFASGGKSQGSFDSKNGVLNLMPKQLSNFGWNWDFFMNTTAEPDFELNAPGLKGKMKIRKPYIKVHSGIYLNFSSEFLGLTLAPKVQWTAGIKGHGRVQARVLGSMNTTGDAGTDPFHAFKLPVLQELENPMWFDKVDFATGTLPIAMEPGFKFSASMYHHGIFHGAIGVGGRTQGWINPTISFDSLKGFESAFHGQLTDTDLWPPLWIIFTKRFELGLLGKPSILMKGDFAGLERATMAIETRPYMNVTISRQGQAGGGPGASDAMKKLTIYPMRVMGISTVDFAKKYQVKISANGQDLETTPQVNWGTVEYRDHISNFDCGEIPQKALLNPSQTKIVITLIQVDDKGSPAQSTLGTGTVTCSSILNGECQPSPANVVILDTSGDTVATVQLAILWQENPAPWFASKIRGLGFSFPQVILRQDTLTAAFPNAEQPTPGSNASSISMRLIHGGQTYIVPLVGTIGSQQSALAGDSTVEFGPGFTDSWVPCQLNTQKCESPRLELYAGSTQIASADVPLIEFSSQTAMQGTSGSGFMASSSSELNVPSTIALSAPGNSGVTIALATMQAKVVMTLDSSIFLNPRSETQVKAGSSEKLQWTISDVDRSKAYTFTVTALRLQSVSSANMQAYVNYRQVNENILVPIKESNKSFSEKCTAKATGGMSAAAAPCSFEYDFPFGNGFNNDDQIVIQVVWSNGGSVSQMYSPPMQVGSSRRLLASPGVDFTSEEHFKSEEHKTVGASPRRLWSQAAWNARIQNHSKSCNKRDLHFNFGLGMLMRGKVDSISVPKGFPMIGGLNEEPTLATQWRKIGGKKPGEDAEDMLGGQDGILCQAGLCKGALPGCSEGGPKKMHFPRLVFDFNRPFHYPNTTHGKFNGLMKQALAYAFSTLPEMVDVMIQQMNESGSLPGSHRSTTTEGPGNWWSRKPSPTPAPSVQWPVKQVTPSPAPSPYAQPQQQKKDSALTSAFHKWWSGATDRRLKEEGADLTAIEQLWGHALESRPLSVAGDKEELPNQLRNHQARLEFKQGVPFIIDRPLVEMMLKHGYFKGLEDVEDDHVAEHGPLEVTRFYVDSGIQEHSQGAESSPLLVEKASAASSSFMFGWSAMVASAAVLGFAATLALRSKRDQPPSPTAHGAGYLGNLSEDEPEGLE